MGLDWRIGNVTMVNALRDKWVPLEDKVMTPATVSTSQDTVRVSDFIDYDCRGWDVAALTQWFDAEMVAAIQSIPLSKN